MKNNVRYTHHMDGTETYTAGVNIRSIEKELGHPLPGGMIDMYSLSDHCLDSTEVFQIVSNIRSIEKARGYKYLSNRSSGESSNSVVGCTLFGLLSFIVGITEGMIGFIIFGIIMMIPGIGKIMKAFSK